VRVNAEARSRYELWADDGLFSVGTLIAAVHRDPSNQALGPTYVLWREQAGWTFLVVDASGGLVPEVETARCQRCHEEANADLVFGPIRRATAATADLEASPDASSRGDAPPPPEP
jgi:hypothetical protein